MQLVTFDQRAFHRYHPKGTVFYLELPIAALGDGDHE